MAVSRNGNGKRPPIAADPQLEHLLAETRRIALVFQIANPQRHRGRVPPHAAEPIFTEAVDHDRLLRRFLVEWVRQGQVLLGEERRPTPLAPRDFLPCPYCHANSLWVDPDQWLVFCGNPVCRDDAGRRYQWRAWWQNGQVQGEVVQLGAMVVQALQELGLAAPGEQTPSEQTPAAG